MEKPSTDESSRIEEATTSDLPPSEPDVVGIKEPSTPPRRDDHRTPPLAAGFDASEIELPPPLLPASAPTTPVAATPTTTPVKSSPVLGIEKAKQRLKAMGIQKKIQMDARNKLTPKTPKAKIRKDSDSGGKKDKKTISPHEKAQNTINEIEILKREEAERPILPPVPQYETMIHHIQADAVDDGRSLGLQMPLTASLEAIKGYSDANEKREERRRRRTKPEAYRGGSSRRRLDFQRSQRQNRRNDHRFAAYRGDRKTKRNGRSRDRREGRRKNRHRSKDRSSRVQSFINCPDAHGTDIFRETEVVRFTKTRPVISFAFNAAAIVARAARKSKAKERKKQKRSRDKKSAEKKRSAAAAVVAAATGTETETIAEVVANPVKKKRSSKDADPEKKKKRRGQKAERPTIVPLSFSVDDLIFDEEIVDFPLAKDGFEVVEDPMVPDEKIEATVRESEPEWLSLAAEEPPAESASIAADVAAAVAVISPKPVVLAAIESLLDDKSPDTDDYMPNWEEEEDSSKDDASIFPLSKIFEQVPDRKDTLETIDESSSESIKDGLGTPIFVNPSPPDELIANLSFEADAAAIATVKPDRIEPNDDDDSKDESSTTPPPRREPLFGMQILYEEFLQSMHDDPDARDARIENTATTTTTATTTSNCSTSAEIESGFVSNDSARLSSPSATSSSSTSSSSSSSSTTTSTPDQFDDGSPKKAAIKKKRRKIRSSTLKLSITSEDLKKLRSLQKRRTMLKIIRKQSDGMDDEDKQCLLGLEKLIRAERRMLLRNDAIKKLQETDQILGSDSDDDDDDGLGATTSHQPDRSTTPPIDNTAAPSPVLGIFDANREAIKLTISNKNASPVKKMQLTPSKIADDETSCDDQDFTEKLKKIAKEESKSSSESDDATLKNRSSSSPRRSLSSSPIRRANHSPSRSARDSGHRKRKSSLSRSKSRSRKSSTRRPRRSRTPPARTKSRFLRSPQYRPPSPPDSSPPSRDSSTSPAEGERKSHDRSPTLPALGSYPGWNIARYPQYYINDSYYYPTGPQGQPLRLPPPPLNGEHSNSPRPRYANPYQNYAQYNLYANEYMAAYQNPAFPLHVTGPHTPPPAVQPPSTADAPYSSIPVLETSAVDGSAAANNFYGYASDEFEKAATRKSNRSNGSVQIKEIIQHDDRSGKSLTFAVQKGNVLEIVPAAILIKQEILDESEILAAAARIKLEPDDDDPDRIESLEAVLGIGTDDEGDTKPSLSSKKRMSWKDEVSRRHVISAVLRLNKETDDSLRGILRSRANSSVVTKDKKKVLFADGIPPGQTSSASSDEEATLKLIRRRLKKKQWRFGNQNKENEHMMEKQQILDTLIATKIDPELWDAPPPPPPIGSPPPNLPQPVPIRSISPEELLYFHFDPVYSMMYVSPMETPVPPRLLEANGKVAGKSAAAASTDAENGETPTPPKSATDASDSVPSPSNDGADNQDGTTPPQQPVSSSPPPSENHDASKSPSSSSPSPPESTPESHTPPPRLPSPVPLPSSPPQQIQNIVSLRMDTASPQQQQQHFSQPPPAIPSPVHSPFDIQQQQRSPVMVGYPMFNRAQRMMSPNMMRGPFNMPPPSAQQLPPPPQQQQQQHCFNPHIPPPFANSPGGGGGGSVVPGPCPPLGYHPPSSNDCSPPFGSNMMMFNSFQQQQQGPPPLPPQQQQPLPPQNFMFNIPAHIMMARTNRFSPVPPPVQQFMHPADSRVESPRLGSPIFRHPLMQQPILQQPNDDNGGP